MNYQHARHAVVNQIEWLSEQGIHGSGKGALSVEQVCSEPWKAVDRNVMAEQQGYPSTDARRRTRDPQEEFRPSLIDDEDEKVLGLAGEFCFCSPFRLRQPRRRLTDAILLLSIGVARRRPPIDRPIGIAATPLSPVHHHTARSGRRDAPPHARLVAHQGGHGIETVYVVPAYYY